jgi:hypothetical protein
LRRVLAWLRGGVRLDKAAVEARHLVTGVGVDTYKPLKVSDAFAKMKMNSR